MPDSLQICPACGTPVADGAAFCDACGAELHAKGAEMESHAEFAENAEANSRAERVVPVLVEGGSGEAEPPPVETHVENAEFAEGVSHAESAGSAERAGASAAPAGGHAMDALLQAARAVLAERRAAAGGSETAMSFRSVSPTLVLAQKTLKAVASSGGAAGLPAAGSPTPPEADEIPFELEWDEARTFVEGRPGKLEFRFKSLCNIAQAAVAATIDGGEAQQQMFRSAMRAGNVRQGLFDFTPDRSGTFSVRLRVETLLDGGTHEFFEADRAIEHRVYPATRQEVVGAGNVTVNYAPTVENNSGIARLDDVRISAPGAQGIRVDNWADMDRVLGRRGSFCPVAFASTAVRRENVRFRASGAALDELLVLPGSDLVSFGRSGSRSDVRLLTETAEGCTDDSRSCYVSGVHFTVRRDRGREEFELFDGGPDGKSKNGLTFDGQFVQSSRTLPPGRTIAVVLAPYAVSGGALPLSFETRGWDDPAAAGCTERPGNLSSLLVRRGDNPRKAVLVVWGAAALDPVLGTETGLGVVSAQGRLYLSGPSGRTRRLIRLAGAPLPGTPYTIR